MSPTEWKDEHVVAFRECDRCKQSLKIVEKNDKQVAMDLSSGERHVCWSLPEDANLLVIGD